jgi:hypothetical protein
MSLHQLFEGGRVWRGGEHAFHQSPDSLRGVPSGYAELDATLPFGGWPRGALSEILHPWPGQGELQLLLPALRRITRSSRYVILIDPPWLPYAPALAAAGLDLAYVLNTGRLDAPDRLWALEQTLRARQCGAVLAWPQADLNTKSLRRLQLAAEAGDSCGFVLRHPRFRAQHSPAALRVEIHPGETRNELEIIKCRGRNAPATRIQLSQY